jgi:hypothetical protein
MSTLYVPNNIKDRDSIADRTNDAVTIRSEQNIALLVHCSAQICKLERKKVFFYFKV